MTAADVLKRYKEEDLPEFLEVVLDDVNKSGNFGNFPIHVAAVRGEVEELEALIAGGADINVAGELGNRPLHDAAGQGHKPVVQSLLNAGADPSATNREGKTARDIADSLGFLAIVGLLETWSRTSGRRH